MDTEELKKQKAKQLRMRRPIVRGLNLDYIKSDLFDIREESETVRWYTDTDDGEDSLVNALCGDENEAREFRMAFSDLCAECDNMLADLAEEWVPECFDLLFVAVSQDGDPLYGWDSYESDYMPICAGADFIRQEACARLSRMKKEELLTAARQCLKVYHSYLGLRNRYDNLKSAMDILKSQNTGYLRTVKEIQRLYDLVTGPYPDYRHVTDFRNFTDALPDEAWLM